MRGADQGRRRAHLRQQLCSALCALNRPPPGVPQLKVLAAEALLGGDLALQVQQPLPDELRARHARELSGDVLRKEVRTV